MNTILRAGWLSGMLFCMIGSLSAQKSSINEDLVKADRQFALYAYNLSMQTYQQVLKDDPNNAHALARIGDCYYQLNNPEKALEWYQRAIRQVNMAPDVHLRYGKALMQTSNYEDARDQFLAYAEKDETVGNHYARACDYAIQNVKKESAWQVKNEALNTEFADFSPAFIGSRVAFNSARTDLIAKSKSSDSPSGAQNFLLVTQQNPESGLLQKPQILRSELQNARNEGPVSFSADGSRVAFCRNNFINGTRQIAESGINMSLYTADVDENGKWANIKAFPYNGSNYATGFPSLSADGNTLIFASTQPGGFGGWDIYVTNFRDGGWTTPRNLGAPLNTPGNEVTPFYDGENLYFSSDWHQGLGGLDVFRAELGPEQVSDVFHLGPGINTARDDYGFIYSADDNVGYVTSTRPGGRGNEDIWRLTKKWNDEVASVNTKKPVEEPYRPSEYNDNSNDPGDRGNGLHVLVTDERGNEIPNAEVDLSDCYGEKGYTGADGKFEFVELTKTIDCQVAIRKTGFRESVITLRKYGNKNVRIALTPDTRETYRGRVFDAKSRAPLRGVTVTVQFDDGSKSIETETDENGAYTLTIDPGTTHLVNYSKYGYVDQIARTAFSETMVNIPSMLLEKAGADATEEYVDYRSDNVRPLEHSTETGVTRTILKKQETTEQAKSATEPVKFSGYSIQLAAMPEEPSDAKLSSYESFTKDGNLFVKYENKLNKIRLGVYRTRAEAEVVWKKVIANKGTKDAFIVEERGASDDLIIGAAPATTTPKSSVKPAEYSIPALDVTLKPVSKPTALYALQLGTFASERSINISDYNSLRGMGNLYSHAENGATQVRLGVWNNYDDALAAKNDAIRKGFAQTTIVTEQSNDSDIQEFIIGGAANTDAKKAKMLSEKNAGVKPAEYDNVSNPAKPYYIRLVALSNPDRFDGSALEDLGYIVKRPATNSPGMTIVLLGGFATKSAADAALPKVKARGYAEAYLMKDDNGKLVRN